MLRWFWALLLFLSVCHTHVCFHVCASQFCHTLHFPLYISRGNTNLQLCYYQSFIHALFVYERLDWLLRWNALLLEEPSELVQALILLAPLEGILVQQRQIVGPAYSECGYVDDTCCACSTTLQVYIGDPAQELHAQELHARTREVHVWPQQRSRSLMS